TMATAKEDWLFHREIKQQKIHTNQTVERLGLKGILQQQLPNKLLSQQILSQNPQPFYERAQQQTSRLTFVGQIQKIQLQTSVQPKANQEERYKILQGVT